MFSLGVEAGAGNHAEGGGPEPAPLVRDAQAHGLGIVQSPRPWVAAST